MKNFPGHVRARKCLKYKEKNDTIFRGQSITENVDVSSAKFRQTYLPIGAVCCTIAAFFKFEKCMTFRIFPQDFPGTGIFKKNIQDFPGGVGTLQNICISGPFDKYFQASNITYPRPRINTAE